jgi:serine phosphatase RsbU (regulator of sigma subunit)
MMDGLDDDWIYTNFEKRYANYTTLPPGDYTFRVKASNNDGIWNDAGTSVKVIIHPPFWKTWWFRTLVTLAFLAAVFILYRRRLSNIRMKIELQTAHDAQMSIMPQSDPAIDGIDVSGICIPAYEVGGDFYDYFWLDEGRSKLGIAVGDVSGKAMQAAMIAVMSSGMLYSKSDESSSPADVAKKINKVLYHKTKETMYTALCLSLVDLVRNEVTYTLAGFSSPLLKSNGSVRSLEGAGHGLPLGALSDSSYREETISLGRGDVMVLFTDGVTDARNNAREFYEHERLVKLLESIDTFNLSASRIKERIVGDVMQFAGNAEQADDMTLVVIKSDIVI